MSDDLEWTDRARARVNPAPFRLAIAAGLLLASGGVTAQVPSGGRASDAPFRIFFDWGESDVSRDGAATLDDVAELLRQPGAGKATLVGHSDRSGAAGANQRSALQRANAVRDYLERRGVASAQLELASQGEDRPIIATADGVREPQNRRVDVILARPVSQ